MSGPVEPSRASTRQLDEWNPPPEADPYAPRSARASEETPSVLSKLQKWVRWQQAQQQYQRTALPAS